MQHFSITDINPAMAHARRVIGAFEEHQITGFWRTGRRTDVIESLGSQPAHIPVQILSISLTDKTRLRDLFDKTIFNDAKELDYPLFKGLFD